MKELTQEGLLKILTNLTNAMEITLVIDSPLKMKKTGNPHVESNIIKHTILNGVIGKNYKTEREKLEKKHDSKILFNLDDHYSLHEPKISLKDGNPILTDEKNDQKNKTPKG